MPGCEMCGRGGQLYKAVVEGSMLSVCKTCASFGHVVKIERPPQPEPQREPERAFSQQEPVEGVTPDYPQLIRKARERKNLTQAKLAEALAEKESVIQKVEAGHMQPSIALAKKLEQFLHITLLVNYTKTPTKDFNIKDQALTIGDLLNIKDEQ